MRHRKRGRKLNRNASHRRALERNMVANLFKQFGSEKEYILTTCAKAKEYSSSAEKFITLAKKSHACLASAAEFAGLSADKLQHGWQGSIRKNQETVRVKKAKRRAKRRGEGTSAIFEKDVFAADPSMKAAAEAFTSLVVEVRGKVEKLLARALYLRRLVASRLQDEKMTKKLFDEIAPVYAERAGGYTRVLKTGARRLGDGTFKAMLAFTPYSDAA